MSIPDRDFGTAYIVHLGLQTITTHFSNLWRERSSLSLVIMMRLQLWQVPPPLPYTHTFAMIELMDLSLINMLGTGEATNSPCLLSFDFVLDISNRDTIPEMYTNTSTNKHQFPHGPSFTKIM